MNRLSKILAAAAMLVALCYGATSYGQQQPQQQQVVRGPLGLFNYKYTNTNPGVPVPSIPTEHTNALCVTSDNTSPGMYPPTGTVAATSSVPTKFDGLTVGAIIGLSFLGGFLVLGGGGRLVENRRKAFTKRSGKK